MCRDPQHTMYQPQSKDQDPHFVVEATLAVYLLLASLIRTRPIKPLRIKAYSWFQIVYGNHGRVCPEVVVEYVSPSALATDTRGGARRVARTGFSSYSSSTPQRRTLAEYAQSSGGSALRQKNILHLDVDLRFVVQECD